MAKRKRPIVVSTRVTEAERALIQLAAEAEGLTISEFLWALIVPRVRAMVIRAAAVDSPDRPLRGDPGAPRADVLAEE